MCYKKDPDRPYRFDWEDLKVGDIVFDNCISGHGTGGFVYDIGDKVTEITDTQIKTKDGSRYSNDDKRISLKPPYGYYLIAFQ